MTLSRELAALRPPKALRHYPSWTLIAVVLFSYFLTFANVLGVEDEDLVCQKGVSGLPGATFPRGDILLREGDTLKVYCRLDMRKTKYNATFIRFQFAKANISEDLMKTTVLNETTAMLEVERMNVSSPHLSCVLANPERLHPQQVCQNVVKVGFPPEPVQDFRCIAPEWRSLNCTWSKPFNPIPTTYQVEILQKSKSYFSRLLARIPCPNATGSHTPTSCTWGPRTEPFYRANLNPLYFRINGTNILNPGGTMWNYTVDHWSIVIPETPGDIEVEKHSPSNNATVSWTFKTFKDFIPGLVHQVKVCVQILSSNCSVTNLMSSKGMDSLKLNIPFEYAYVNYSIQVRMRSQAAKDEEDFWSKPAVVWVESDARSPGAPPKVDIGSYESVTKGEKLRDIFVYWEDVPRLLHNGPGFHYVITVLEDEEKRDIKPERISGSYAKFTGLGIHKAYRFQILSANDMGNSPSESQVSVPRFNKAIKPPTAVSKLDFTNGSFAVNWHPPTTSQLDSPIVSYTVFRCVIAKPRPYQCDGLLSWDIVGAGKTSKVYGNLHGNFQFAVAANTGVWSSGMAWASSSCTLIHGEVPDKLRRPERKEEEEKDEKEIHIGWKLDCSYKPGIIEGFKISYCRVEKRKTEKCLDSEMQDAVFGANTTTYQLKRLQPCSTYKIEVSVISINGDSQKSEPLYATTKQGVPSGPPTVEIESTTNTSAFLMVTPPNPLNGILKEYKIKYKSEESDNVFEYTKFMDFQELETETVDACVPTTDLPKAARLEVKGLNSSSNYTFNVSACTIRCSEYSIPVSSKTKEGKTDLKSYPKLRVDGNNMIVEWGVPSVRRGPIEKFEVLMLQNGDIVTTDPVYFVDGRSKYEKSVDFSCGRDTNITAQVRAITKLDNGEYLIGDWSPAGNFNCGGGSTWVLWILLVVGAILIICLFGLGANKLSDRIQNMKEVNVKIPPGLTVQDLNGFTHGHPRRKSSDGDMHSLDKENGTYQLQTLHHSEDMKDFPDSCPQESGLGIDNLGEMRNFDNKMCMDEPEHGKPARANVNTQVMKTDPGSRVDPWSVKEPSIQVSAVETEKLLHKRLSSSPTKPLMEISSIPEEDLEGSDSANLCETIDMKSFLDGFAISGPSFRPESTSPSPELCMKESVNPHSHIPDVITSTPQVTTFSSPTNPPGNLNLPPNPSSSYVKWTHMMPDQFINGDTNLNLDCAPKAPYCQVGIILDSN